MYNNSERSKKWRNKRKTDPSYRENERKRKQESRKRRNEDQRKRDREQCRARQKKYRERKRKLSVISSDDSLEDPGFVCGSIVSGDSMDTGSASSIPRSNKLVASVSKSDGIGLHVDSQSSGKNEYRSFEDSVFAMKVSEPVKQDVETNRSEPMGNVNIETGDWINHLHHPVASVQMQDSCDDKQTTSDLPFATFLNNTSNNVLQDVTENVLSVKETEGIGNFHHLADQSHESTSETDFGIFTITEGTSEQEREPEPQFDNGVSLTAKGSESTEEFGIGSRCYQSTSLKNSCTNSSLIGKKTSKWIQQYAEGENHEVMSFLTNDVIHTVASQRKEFFVRMQQEFLQIEDFEVLKSRCVDVFREIEERYQMSTIPILGRSGHQRDDKAFSLYPTDAPPDHVPVKIVEDGNCLPRVGSLFAFGNEQRHPEMRVRIFIELCIFEDTYLNDSYLNRGLNNSTKRTAGLIAQYVEVFPRDVPGPDWYKYIYRINTKHVLKPGSYNGMWSVFALASVLGVRLQSIYPDYGGRNVRDDHNRLIMPRVSRNNHTVIHIMWTNTRGKQPPASVWVPNHFVAVLHKSTIDDKPIAAVGSPEVTATEKLTDITSNNASDKERLQLSDDSGPSQMVPSYNILNTADSSETATPKANITWTSHQDCPVPAAVGPVERNEDTCFYHVNEKPVYLCNTCKGRPICYKCPLEGHKYHDYEDLNSHLESKERIYLQMALRKNAMVLKKEMEKGKIENEENIRKIAAELDSRVEDITELLQKWREECLKKLQTDGQAIYNNITLSGARTLLNYDRNLKQELRRLNTTKRLAKMSEQPPVDIEVNTGPLTYVQFTPGATEHLIQEFGRLSYILSDTEGSKTGNTATSSAICDSLEITSIDTFLQSHALLTSSSQMAQTAESEDLEDAVATLHSTKSIVAINSDDKKQTMVAKEENAE